jgi:hypothetical protein
MMVKPDAAKCADCGLATWWDGLVGHRPGCAVLERWRAVRPDVRVARGRPNDTQWFAEHPDEDVLVRELTVDEQLARFVQFGAPLTHVLLARVREDVPVGKGTVTKEYVRIRGLW